MKQSKVVKWSLIIGIVIVLNLFFNYALSLVYKAPDYQTYCPNEQIISPPTDQSKCVAIGGQWTENTFPQDKTQPATITHPAVEVQGYCNPTYTCQKNFDTDMQVYEKNVFITLVVLGILSIIVGLFVRTTEVVTIAFSFGGVLSLLIASIRYWSQAQNLLKVVILGLALVALIWVAIKKFKE